MPQIPENEFPKFFVWIIPSKRTVLVEDRGVLPADLPKDDFDAAILIIFNISFDTWEEAFVYGDKIASIMNWTLELDNESGRFVEFDIKQGNIF